MAVLERIAMANTGARRKFCKFMIKYLRATWLNGSIPREVWNMYQHEGVTTNNHAEVIIRSKLNRITILPSGFQLQNGLEEENLQTSKSICLS